MTAGLAGRAGRPARILRAPAPPVFSNWRGGCIIVRVTPIRDLGQLLRGLNPHLEPTTYAFCKVADERAFFALGIVPHGFFREREGLTVIVDRADADRVGLAYGPAWALITLTVNSDLLAVGLLAKVTERLAAGGISVNAISAFHHDHLFVPADQAMEALQRLHGLMAESNRGAGGA